MKVKNLNNHIRHIVTGFEQQALLYTKLLKFSRELERQLADGTGEGFPENISSIIKQRSGIINDIIKIDEDIEPHKKAVMSILHLKEFNLNRVQDLIFPELRKSFFEQKQIIEKIIKQLIEIDQRNEAALKDNMQGLAMELKKIKQHHQIKQTYLDSPEKFPEPRFLDKKE